MKRGNDTFARELNPLLYGHNPDARIVAVHQRSDSLVRIYRRLEGGIQHEDVEFFPFFFLSDASLMQDFPAFHWMKELAGNHYFRYLVAFKQWSSMWEAINFIIGEYNKTRRPPASGYQYVEALLFRPDPSYQFLIQSGRTLFKAMAFDELHRLQIDIQVAAKDQRLSHANKNDARIIVISLSDNRDWNSQFDARKLSEKEMIEKCSEAIRERDPDVIEGHELFSFVMPYMMQRADLQNVELRIGRDGSAVRTYQKRFFTEEEYTVYECVGRHFVGTLHLVRTYDYSKRSLEDYDLTHLAEHFDLAQSYPIPKARILATWEEQAATVLQHSMENTRLVREISDLLSPSNFSLAQMCPFNYGTITELGSSARLESLIVREYLRQKHSVPQPQKGAQAVGGYTNIYVSGVLRNVLQADIESLYPSIMISDRVKPRSDVLDVFIPLLSELTSLRLQAKRNMLQARSDQIRKRLDATQLAFKILINSFYGYLAYNRALFNDFSQADAVTTRGQSILTSMISKMELFNAQPIEADTDGIFFVPPDNVRGEKNEEEFIGRIAKQLSEGISLVKAGRFAKMLSYKMKNYALLDYEDNLVIRGSSLASRALERFLRRFIRRCIECLLSEDAAQLHHTYASFSTQIKTHQWEAADFCRTETLREDLATYIRLLEQDRRHPTAAYEAARRAGLYFKAGERISYYVTGSQPDVRISDCSRVAAEWDPNLPDENTAYYLSRLDESSDKFRVFFEPESFKKIFSLDDLFGFSPEGIRILTTKAPQEPETEAPKEADESEVFPIWIEEKG